MAFIQHHFICKFQLLIFLSVSFKHYLESSYGKQIVLNTGWLLAQKIILDNLYPKKVMDWSFRVSDLNNPLNPVY